MQYCDIPDGVSYANREKLLNTIIQGYDAFKLGVGFSVDAILYYIFYSPKYG